MSIFICPVCGKKLEFSDKNCFCENNHSFDRAKSGYVNLLLSKHAGKSVHGDNKLMVRSRRDFLEKGYYSKLCELMCRTVKKNFRSGIILDAGCGEGYYTSAVCETVGNSAEVYGIDISKTAVDYAAKRKTSAVYATASVFHIPVSDCSCDMIITMFAPYCGEEFKRILKPDGIMIMAIPSEEHLWELKQTVYDEPYKNEVKPYELDGFHIFGKKRLRYKILLDNQKDIQSLFSMTPYYYRTGKEQQERLAILDKLETTVDFELLTYRND